MYGKITEKELSPSLLNKIEGRSGNKTTISRDESKIFISTNTIKLKNDTKTLLIEIKDYNKAKDCLMVFENGTYMEENFDYEISDDSTKITSLSNEWKAGTIIKIIVLKNGYQLNQIKKITQVTTDITNIIEIGTMYDPKTDTIMIFKNSLYIEQGSDYQISDENNHIINLNGKWNKDTSFNIIIFKNSIKSESIDKHTNILNSSSNTVDIGINNYNKDFDVLFAFENGTYIIRDEDFTISENSNQIISKKSQWESKTSFNFIVIGDILYNSNKIFESSYNLDTNINTVPINNENYEKENDLLLAFQNSVFIDEETSYEISKNNKNIIKRQGNWNSDTLFNFIILNDVLKDKKIYKGTEILSQHDVKVQISVQEYNHKTDLLITFRNGTFMDSSDYIIADDGQFIIKANQTIKWKSSSIFNFIVIKNVLNTGLIVQKVKILDTNSKSFNIEIPKFDSKNDKLLLFKNSVFVQSSDYDIVDNKTININEDKEWNKGTKLNMIVIKDSIQSEIESIGGISKDDLSYDLANMLEISTKDTELCKLNIKNLLDTIIKLTKRVDELEKRK